MIKTKGINRHNFKRFGWVIEFPAKNLQNKSKNLFRIVARERALSGWRIAYLVVRDKQISRLEQHPDSLESFEPVKGRSLLYVSLSGASKQTECFILDKPVILKKGIWHAVITSAKESEIKITENLKVSCLYKPF